MRELKSERIREMTEDEILGKIRELKEEIFNLSFRNRMRQLQNPLLLRERRRDIARMETILSEHRKGLRPLAGHAAAAGEPGAKKPAKTAAGAKTSGAKAASPKKAAKKKAGGKKVAGKRAGAKRATNKATKKATPRKAKTS